MLKQEYYSEVHCMNRMPDISLSNLYRDKWAFLSGSTVKAANTRSLVPFGLKFCRLFLTSGSAVDNSITRLFESLVEFYDLIYTAGMFLKQDEKLKLHGILQTLGIQFCFLRDQSRLIGALEWQILPKIHYMMHLGFQAEVLNIRTSQNYAEESLVGKVTRITKASCVRTVFEYG